MTKGSGFLILQRTTGEQTREAPDVSFFSFPISRSIHREALLRSDADALVLWRSPPHRRVISLIVDRRFRVSDTRFSAEAGIRDGRRGNTHETVLSGTVDSTFFDPVLRRLAIFVEELRRRRR